MSLNNILVSLATVGALRLDDADQVAYETFRVNTAAKELYESTDLVGCLREQVLNVDVDENSSRIVLPYYIGKLRAVRYMNPNVDLGLVDMRPKYAERVWNDKNLVAWRLLEQRPLFKSITNGSLFTFTFTAPLETACNIVIKGASDIAQDDVETLAFAIGDTTKTTTKSFIDITSIVKSCVTNADCSVMDADNVEMANIPNNQLKSLYQIVQLAKVYSNTQVVPATQYVEVLWKERFKPLALLTDEFQCPGYDECVVYKYLAQRAMLSENVSAKANAAIYESKVSELIRQIDYDSSQTTDKRMTFGSNQFYDITDELIDNRYICCR